MASLREGTPSDDVMVRTLVRALESLDNTSDELKAALSIWQDLAKKCYVEAYLLVTDVTSVAVALDMPTGVVQTYQEFFFDTDVFADKLQKYSYAHGLSDGPGKELKLLALTMGREFIDWRLGNTLSIRPDEVLSRLLTDSYAMAKIGMQSGMVTSKSAKEAYRWATLAAKLADTLSRREAAEETDDIFEGLQVVPVFDEVDISDALDLDPALIIRG